MSITHAALSKTRITYTFLALIAISGYQAYKNMPRSQDPGFIIRTAMIRTVFPGASPERVEELVSDPLEKAIKEMPELDIIRSTSKTGISIIYVDIKEKYTKLRPIWDSLRRKVDRERPNLPDEVIGPFVNDEFGDTYGIIISIIGDGFSYAEIKEVADQSRDELLRLQNVAKVNIVGHQEERVFLEFNNARLARLGITPYQLAQILETQNIVIPGGSVKIDEERLFLEPTGNFEAVADIEDALISLPGQGEAIYLKDIVSIKRGYVDPPNRGMYSSGYPSLGLAVSMVEGGNIIDLGAEVKETVAQLRMDYPIGIEFDIVAFEPEAVAVTIHNFTSSLLQAVVVVMIVMVLFLGLRTGLVVASLIPATILTTFLVMSWLSIGLDKISLAALIISLGLLVDNAIVMSESCMVLMGEGKSPTDAAVQSASELRIPLLTSSLTTAAAFLPIFLAESATGEYTASLFKVVTISLLSSWLMALTLIPMLCAIFIKVEKAKEDGFNSNFYKIYRKLLLGGLRWPIVCIAAILVIFFTSMYLFKYVKKAFFPDSNQPMFTVELELPTPTDITETDKIAQDLNAFIKAQLTATDDREGVTNWTTYVGEGAPRFYLTYAPDPPTPSFAFFLFNVSDYRATPELIQKLSAYCREHYPDVKLNGKPLANGPPVNNPIEVRLSGRDTDELFRLVERVRNKLGEIPGTVNIDDDWGFRSKKIVVDVNQAKARRAGLSSRDIAISLQTVLSGLEVTQYREDDKIIPIILRSVAADRQDLGKLEQLSVYSSLNGKAVPLQQIADIRVVWEPPKILRRNGIRTVTVSSKLNTSTTPTDVEAVLVPWLEEESKNWAPGYRFEMGGENAESASSQASIAAKLGIAGMLIVLLLVSQFNSMRRPMIILATLPLGLIGVSIGLLVTGAALGFMAFLGVISLMGIVINNAIVLIDRIDLEINDAGRTPADAIIEASQRRLRPILLTTVTTLAGLIPLWTGGDPMFMPMAISIIFGLFFATFLTLGVVPLLYSLFFKVSFKGYTYK